MNLRSGKCLSQKNYFANSLEETSNKSDYIVIKNDLFTNPFVKEMQYFLFYKQKEFNLLLIEEKRRNNCDAYINYDLLQKSLISIKIDKSKVIYEMYSYVWDNKDQIEGLKTDVIVQKIIIGLKKEVNRLIGEVIELMSDVLERCSENRGYFHNLGNIIIVLNNVFDKINV